MYYLAWLKNEGWMSKKETEKTGSGFIIEGLACEIRECELALMGVRDPSRCLSKWVTELLFLDSLHWW